MGFRFRDFEIDLERQELRHAGTTVHIEPQVFDLLVHLIRNRERVVGKDELIDTVWQGRIVSESTLSSRISAARRVLGDSGNDQTLIRTLHKRGFRFVGEVEDDSTALPPRETAHETAGLVPSGEPLAFSGESSLATFPSKAIKPSQQPQADDLTLEPSSSRISFDLTSSIIEQQTLGLSEAGTAAAPRYTPTTWQPGKGLMIAAALAVPALLFAAIAWQHAPKPSLSPVAEAGSPVVPADETALPMSRQAALAPSIIITPFINLSGDARQDYVADGITDSLISDLAGALPGMSVVSRGTAFTYKGRATDARQIGRELEVRYLLSGSVALEGERARVNIQLVETKDGNQLWAERFDTERRSILQVQDEIVSRVSRAIGLKVVDIEARRSRRERPSSTELMDLVLRGKAVLNRPSTPATMIEARGLFEQALKVKEDDVDALAGVATTLVFEFVNGYYETEGDERLRKAELLLDQAGAAEPRNLMVLRAKAALRRAQGKFEDAITAAQAIIAENPGEPWAYKEIGLSTMYLGQPEQALDWFSKADRIGPHDPGRWTWLDGQGHALILLGRDEEAVHALIGALDANPKQFSSHAFLAAAYALLGRSDDARYSLAAYLEKRPDVKVSTFRRYSPVPLTLTSATYQRQQQRIGDGLRRAGMPD